MQTNRLELIQVAGELAKDACLSATFGKEAFAGQVPSETDVQAFLHRCGLFDNTLKRWINIPQAPQRDTELLIPLSQIFEAVLEGFCSTATREVRYTLRHPMVPDQSAMPLLLFPDIMSMITGIKNSWPSVVNLTNRTGTPFNDLYSRCISPTQIKARRNVDDTKDLQQLAVFATLCFRMQCNRSAVYSLRITEQDVVLYLFDHGGVLYSSSINIHDNPIDFIRLILGVISPDDTLIGFDKNVFWKGHQRFIQTTNADGNRICYPLTHPEPIYKHKSVKGISTICWKATDPASGMELVVKDMWAPDNGNMEIQLLEASQGLLGVGQIVSYEVGPRISARRILDTDDIKPSNRQKPKFSDPIFTRITLQDGGRPITEFESPEEVLYAFRDAIAGHQNLWNNGILHRDINTGNILIGPPGSTVGNKGVLIDLSHAVWLDRSKSPERFTRGGVGTRTFLSVNILECWRPGGRPSPHDYLDDLESFFYVFCWIVFRYSGPAALANPPPSFLINWSNIANSIAEAAKKAMYYDQAVHASISDFFGPSFRKLVKKLLGFFNTKIKDRKQNTSQSLIVEVDQLTTAAEDDYRTVLTFFDEAITELASSKETPGDPEVAAPSSGVATPVVATSNTASLTLVPGSKFKKSETSKRRRENNSLETGSSSTKKRKD